MGGSEVPAIEEVVRNVQRDVFELERTQVRIEARLTAMDAKLDRIESLSPRVDGLGAKSDKILSELRSLASMTARSSSGQTLINLVSLINDKVKSL
jgi:hypothetical protein